MGGKSEHKGFTCSLRKKKKLFLCEFKSSAVLQEGKWILGWPSFGLFVTVWKWTIKISLKDFKTAH